MRSGAPITVVCDGAPVHATAVHINGKWWWLSNCKSRSGKLGDEDIHYVRGYLHTWWPPHRKRKSALLVAAALGDTPKAAMSNISPATAKRLMDNMMKLINVDVSKLMRDAENMMDDVEKLGFRRRP